MHWYRIAQIIVNDPSKAGLGITDSRFATPAGIGHRDYHGEETNVPEYLWLWNQDHLEWIEAKEGESHINYWHDLVDGTDEKQLDDIYHGRADIVDGRTRVSVYCGFGSAVLPKTIPRFLLSAIGKAFGEESEVYLV